jgi:hypothetical protein
VTTPQNGTIWDWLAMQQYALPEWSGGKNGQYQPADVGSQASQLNYLQDLLSSGMDPFLGLLSGDGGYNPSSFDSTYEDAVIPAVTAGTDYLNKILSDADPVSAEALIAEGIMAGRSPIEVVNLAVEKGIIQVPEIRDAAMGAMKPDTSARDYYTKFATNAWEKLMTDRPDQVTRSEVPNPNLERIKAAGFTDPRQQWTADFIQPYSQQFMDQSASDLDAYRQVGQQFRTDKARPDPAAATPQATAMGRLVEGAGAANAALAKYFPGRRSTGAPAAESLGGRVDPGVFARIAATPPPTPASSRPTSIKPGHQAKTSQASVDAAKKRAMESYSDSARVRGAASGIAMARQAQGRTPFLDAVAQRMTSLLQRGVGQ